MTSAFNPPSFEEFTLKEKTLIKRLHTQYGNDWKKIAMRLPGRTPLLIKTYWLKKQRTERALSKVSPSSISRPIRASHTGTRITFYFKSPDPFSWPMHPLSGTQSCIPDATTDKKLPAQLSSPLDLLLLAALEIELSD